MEGARAAGTSTPRSAEARTRKSAISSPPSLRRSSASISAPISRSVTRSPVRSGLVITSVRLAPERDLAALRAFRLDPNVGAEMLEQTFGVIAARLVFDDGGFARRGEAREQHRRLDLRRRHRRAIDDGNGIARAGEGQRQPAAVGDA